MNRRTYTSAALAMAALLVNCHVSIASPTQGSDDAAIDAYIARQAQRERGEEYREARKVVVGDLTHDGLPETVVLYTIEGQGGTNLSTQYLAVFSHKNGKLVPVTYAAMRNERIGGVELTSVKDDAVVLSTLSYGPKDAACCPSIPSTKRYVLTGKVLRVAKTTATTKRYN